MTSLSAPPTFAMALPDDLMARAVIDAEGNPQMVLPNQLKLPPQTVALLKDAEQITWFPKQADAPRVLAGPVVNFCADFDTYRLALRSMADWFPSETVIFNHPTAIAFAANDRLLEKIKVPGLEMPLSIRVRPQKPHDFEATFAAAKLRYPVRVQLTRARDNGSVIVVNNASEWDKVLRTDWPGQWFRIAQLKQQDLQQHLRYRVCFVGRQAEITTFPFAYPPMKVLKEIKMTWKTNSDALLKICRGLAQHVPLDFWTAEFSAIGSDELKLEHLWVGLPQSASHGRPDHSAALWPQVAPKLHDLVQDPTKWRSWKQQGQQKAN